MKIFHIQTGALGELLLDATNKTDAISGLYNDGWVNGGRMTIVCREYKLVKTTRFSVNTDYGKPVAVRDES